VFLERLFGRISNSPLSDLFAYARDVSRRKALRDSSGRIRIAPNVFVEKSALQNYGAAIVAEGAVSKIENSDEVLSGLQRAESLLRKTVHDAPLWIDALRALGRNLWFQGRFAEAIDAFARAEGLRADLAAAAGWNINACVMLPRNCAQSISLMGHMGGFVKRKILSGDARPYVLLAPPADVVNSAFLSYFEPHLTIVSEADRIDQLAMFESVFGVNWN